MGIQRDDFTSATRELLAKRVGYRCSNPGCRRPTSGPSSDEGKSISTGEAAHICSAAPGGKRYDPSMTGQERSSAANGIWLCGTCHKLVDSDDSRYTVADLYRWKQQAENQAAVEMETVPRPPAENGDMELLKFYIQCLDRPAFHDPLAKQMRGHDRWLLDFEQAVSDTILALNTGVLRTRDGDIIKRAEGKSQVRNEQWREKLDRIVQLLGSIRNTLRCRDLEAPKLAWYDHNLVQWLEQTRGEVMELINSICREAGLHELKVWIRPL